MRALGYASDEAVLVARGEVCVSCREPFVKAHGQETACHYCWSRLTAEEKDAVLRAVYEESTAAEFKRRARKAKRLRVDNTAELEESN